jgi:RND family efflux transporter MFP subunit
MSANVDLRQLAVRRDVPPPRPPSRRRAQLVTRYLLPGGVLLGFLGVAAWAARDGLLPARPVTVVPVLTSRAPVSQGGAPLFQAAGWVEPRPTPVVVTALAEGVVDKLLVVEGQEVQAGEVVARLLDADAKLALEAAQADLQLRQAERSSARAALGAARTNFAQPAHLQAAAAEADALLAQKETDLVDVPFQLRQAEARLWLARRDHEAKNAGSRSGAIPDVQVRLSKKELDTATAAVEQLQARERGLKREVEALKGKSAALQKRLELKTEEARQRAEAEASVQAAEARVGQARVAVAVARLRLERTAVRAPTAGRVLALVARPGMRLMGLAHGSLHESSTVASLYDPSSLQVRADVRLEDLPRVQPGQPVRIETPAVGGALEGEVLRATSQADVQKNTLQVKVAVKAPPAVLRPDMLVQVTFLAPAGPKATPGGPEPYRLLVPRQLVEADGSGAHVWVADRVARVARRRPVQLGAAGAGDLVEVTDGLSAADKLIVGGREGLRDGQRVAVTGEDTTLGVAAGGPGAKPARPGRNPAGGGHPGKH